jgi:hypothetical protein
VITNTLQNNLTYSPTYNDENEAQEEAGFTVKGSITLNDNDNNLGYRPENIIINLYMDGELLKSITKDSNATSYAFTNLERYIYNDDGTVKETHIYQIEAVMNPTPSYIADGETTEAYTIEYSVPEIDAKDGSAIINITSTFNNAEDIIPVKPYNNSLTVKTNQGDYTEIVLKKMDADYIDNEVAYKDTCSEIYYNLELNNITETISHMITGKYEITTTSSLFIIDNVELLDNEYISLIKENGKYYIVVEETSNDACGFIVFNLSEKEHKGYQTEPDIKDNNKVNNIWKITVTVSTETVAKTKISRRIVAPIIIEKSEESSETETIQSESH